MLVEGVTAECFYIVGIALATDHMQQSDKIDSYVSWSFIKGIAMEQKMVILYRPIFSKPSQKFRK